MEVQEELLSGHRYVPVKNLPIVPPTEQHEVVELQERFQPFLAEQVKVVID
jgi:hypothetical protein